MSETVGTKNEGGLTDLSKRDGAGGRPVSGMLSARLGRQDDIGVNTDLYRSSGFRRIFFVLQWLALGFSITCGLAYFFFDQDSVAYTGVLIFVFWVVSVVVCERIDQKSVQTAIMIGCTAILCSSLLMLFVRPALHQTLAVTALLSVSVALPYAEEKFLKVFMVAAWSSVMVIGFFGPQLASQPKSFFNLVFGTATAAAAAGVSLFVLWQFRWHLLNSLAQARAAEERVRYESRHDSLTGLANRVLLSEKLAEILHSLNAEGEKAASSHSLLFLDLDRFKHVNDSLGHSTGDEFLKVVADRISSCIREEDAIARMGGDEFVVIMEDVHPGDAGFLAQRIQSVLSVPMKLHGHELYATVSIGIVNSFAGYDDPQGPIRDADTAMYRAKATGRARSVVFDTDMRHNAISLLKLENDLRRAVEQEEFVVHYQPVVWLTSGGISGFEALVRWRHPERGLLYPDVFIRLAEETSLIHDIDHLVLREACRQTASWREVHRDPFPPTVSVNLSPTGLIRPGFIREVTRVLAETGLPGHALIIELTESAVMQDAETSMKVLHRLRRLGVRVHVDDFGTGYSSLQLLHRLPVDALKIDKSFVSGTSADDPNGLTRGVMGENAEIVQTILTMAHALGMEVVGEGVETDEHLEVLREMGCDHVQGYRFSKPVPAAGAADILAAEPVW